jgi:nitrogen regulatory protein PII
MRVIVATIRPEKLMAVQQALDGQEVRLMYAAQVADVWHEQTCTYRGLKYQMPQPRLRLEILAVDEKTVSEILEASTRLHSRATRGSTVAAIFLLRK